MPEPTDDMTPFEARFAARLQADAAWGARFTDSRDVADAVFRVAGDRSGSAWWARLTLPSRGWAFAGMTLLLIAVGLAVAALVATRPHPTFPTNLLAYTDDGSRSLWMVPRGGGSARLVARPDGRVGPLEWAPDGRWVATMTLDDQRIVLIRPDGSETRVIGRGHDVRWSRDGRRLAFVESTPDGGTVVLRDLESGREDILPTPDGFSSVQLIGWLGDDAHVLVRACAGCGYTQDHRYGWFTLPGGQPAELPANAQPGTLSPDGWRLAWSPCASGVANPCPGLFVSDLRTNETRQVGDPNLNAYDPMAWGPDGTWIVYPTGDPSAFATADAIAKAHLDGSAPVELYSGSADAAVSPDGTELAVVPIGDGTSGDIKLISSGGSRPADLVHGSSIGWFAWQPSSRVILSPEDPAVEPSVATCVPAPDENGRMPRFDGAGCMVIRIDPMVNPDIGLDLDPDVAPIHVLDVNWDRRIETSPGVLTGINGASLVPLPADETCDAATFAAVPATPSADEATSPVGSGRRWCVLTKGGTRVALTLDGYDNAYGAVFSYERRP